MTTAPERAKRHSSLWNGIYGAANLITWTRAGRFIYLVLFASTPTAQWRLRTSADIHNIIPYLCENCFKRMFNKHDSGCDFG